MKLMNCLSKLREILKKILKLVILNILLNHLLSIISQFSREILNFKHQKLILISSEYILIKKIINY